MVNEHCSRRGRFKRELAFELVHPPTVSDKWVQKFILHWFLRASCLQTWGTEDHLAPNLANHVSHFSYLQKVFAFSTTWLFW